MILIKFDKSEFLAECITLRLGHDHDELLGRLVNDMPGGFKKWIERDEHTPEQIASAWTNTLNQNFSDREFTASAVFVLFKKLFAEHRKGSPLDQTLREHGLNVTGSWFEASRRLAGSLFHLGRLGTPSPVKRIWLIKSIELLSFLIENDKFVSPQKIIRYNGYKGVASLLLAREDDDPKYRYEAAVRCLKISREAGDLSVQNGEYLVEALMHLFDLTADAVWLERAEITLSETTHGLHSPKWSMLKGEWELKQGIQISTRDTESALENFRKAERHLSLALCHSTEILESYYEHAMRLRGRARYSICESNRRLGREVPKHVLDGSLEDLTSLRPNGTPFGFGGMTLPSALLMRARLYQKDGFLSEARALLSKAVAMPLKGLNESDLVRSLKFFGMQLNIEESIQNGDAFAVGSACKSLLNSRDEGKLPYISLARAGKFLLSSTSPSVPEFHQIVEEIIAEGNAVLASEIHTVDEKAHLTAYAGALALQYARTAVHPAYFATAYRFYRHTLDGDSALISPETFGLAGDAALQTAKYLGSEGLADQAIEYLEDAKKHFQKAIEAATTGESSEHFRLTVAHSKLGETLFRLDGYFGTPSILEEAISHFEESHRLGNHDPSLMGLLADCHYRRGRLSNSVSDLMRCVKLKELARDAGHFQRENFSVSARVHFLLGGLTGNTMEYQTGMTLLNRVLEDHADWPWPFFQLLEFVDTLRNFDRILLLKQISEELSSPELRRAFAEGDIGLLADAAIAAVMRSREFERRKLGGRQNNWDLVFVINDSHKLLGESYVFKQTSPVKANLDHKTVSSLRTFLGAKKAPISFSLPSPLRIMQIDENRAIYLMRKARGIQLGRFAIKKDGGGNQNTENLFNIATRYLAHFHAWSSERGLQWESLRQAEVPRGGLSKPDFKALISSLPDEWPIFRKKDAHPENWLVTPNNRLVMIDFESGSSWPFLFDLAQLLDDYPLFSPDDQGWEKRRSQVELYIRQLEDLGVILDLPLPICEAAYAAFVVLRCAAGLRRHDAFLQKSTESCSISTLNNANLRSRHYKRTLNFLASQNLASRTVIEKILAG